MRRYTKNQLFNLNKDCDKLDFLVLHGKYQLLEEFHEPVVVEPGDRHHLTEFEEAKKRFWCSVKECGVRL